LTFIVTEACQGCRYTDCVEACPVDCFHGDEQMLYIDPSTCIDCGACVPECPVEAIYEEGTLPNDLSHWLEVNRDRAPRLPIVSGRQAPLATAEERARRFGFKPR
jgi:ferredoxin